MVKVGRTERLCDVYDVQGEMEQKSINKCLKCFQRTFIINYYKYNKFLYLYKYLMFCVFNVFIPSEENYYFLNNGNNLFVVINFSNIMTLL